MIQLSYCVHEGRGDIHYSVAGGSTKFGSVGGDLQNSVAGESTKFCRGRDLQIL